MGGYFIMEKKEVYAMKKLLCILLCVFLCGCAAAPEVTTAPTTAAATETTAAPVETTVTPTTEATVPPTTEATVPPTTEAPVTTAVPYLLKINNYDQKIYAAPAYQGEAISTVKEAGTYTIVEEYTENGETWGKLKSGAGWVNVTEIRQTNDTLLISVSEGKVSASAVLGTRGDYDMQVAIRAYRELENVQIAPVDWSTGDCGHGEPRYTLSKLSPGEPTVVWLDFPGDMSTWLVIFTLDGTEHIYSISCGGFDGTLHLAPHTHWEE